MRIRVLRGMRLLEIDAVGIDGGGIDRVVGHRNERDRRDQWNAELLPIGKNRRRGAAYLHGSIIG